MPQKFVCLRKETPGWLEYELAPPAADEVQIRHQFGAEKHGTMMAFYKGYGNDRGRWDREKKMHIPHDGVLWDYPVPLGNMNVGIVEKTGSAVLALKEGDRVLSYGGFQPTANKPASACWKLPKDVPWESAVCLDPANYALGAMRDGDVRVGDRVAVFGMGAIGLMCVQMARVCGAETIIALDPLPHRREVATRFGATHVIDPVASKAGELIRDYTGGEGADVVVEYSGSVAAMQQSLIGVCYGGTVVAGAFPPPYPAGLDFGGEAHMNRAHIVFSRTESEPNRDYPRWSHRRILEATFTLICRGQLDARPLLDPVVSFGDLMTEYPKIATQPNANIKMGVRYA
ncbi:MAG TPA: zinc-binding alcohol dehydrogenase [Opitutaceae bacterium]|nr:zinc-binding alcohol dehydrogenase [Opitutaceae bacterium]